jgi:hypothetical protein
LEEPKTVFELIVVLLIAVCGLPILALGTGIYRWLRRRGVDRPNAWIHRLPTGRKFWLPVSLAVLAAPGTAFVCRIVYGIGCSHFTPPFFPKLIIPFAMLASLLCDYNDFVMLYGAGIQVLVYGILLGLSWSRRSLRIFGFLFLAHAIATFVLCLVSPGNEF